jgi:protocatechuate 3,4-dioxygenase beta subunit
MTLSVAVLGGQPAVPKKPGSVEGMVINSVTGDPLKKATVTLQALGRNANYAAVTDSAGHFHFDSVEPGNYQAVASRDGFIAFRRNPRGPFGSKSFVVGDEQQIKDLVVKLLPLAVVSGHVFDEDGDPIARAQVQALRYVYRHGGSKRLNPAGFSGTNDLGEYQILDLDPGRYYFRVTVHQRQARLQIRTRSASPEQAYPDTFYPSATQPAQATASQVAPGAQLTGIDFRLHKAPAYRVRGKAIDGRTGQPVRNAMLHFQPRESIFGDAVRVQQDGTFDVRGVVSGPYLLAGRISGELSSQHMVNVGDHDVDDVLLVFRPPLEIPGSVLMEGVPPETKGAIQVGLEAMETGSTAYAAVNPDGSFVLKVMPGVYHFSARVATGAYVKSVRLGDQDVSSGQIDLTQQTSGALNILLGTDLGHLQGSVQTENGEPAPEVLITVCPDDEHQGRRDLFYQLASDQNVAIL